MNIFTDKENKKYMSIGIFSYQENHKKGLLTLAFFVLAFVLYAFYYDILIPGLPDGSYRLATNNGLIIVAFLLAGGQTAIGGFFLNVCAGASGAKLDYQNGLLISAFMTFMFSMTYFFFPNFGPFYYIAFATSNAPWYVFPFEVIWTAIVICTSALITKREYNIGIAHALLFCAIAYTFITVGAS